MTPEIDTDTFVAGVRALPQHFRTRAGRNGFVVDGQRYAVTVKDLEGLGFHMQLGGTFGEWFAGQCEGLVRLKGKR